MAAKISRDALEGFLQCKYKARLKLAGEQGSKCDYEGLLTESRQGVRRQATEKILARHGEGEVARGVPLTEAGLRLGRPFLLDAVLEDGLISLPFDGLKKVEGASKLGDFHYLPVLFHEGRQVGKVQRRLLELLGLLLSRIQGRMPANGIIYHGRECKAGKVRLNPDVRKADQSLRELQALAAGEAAPKLLLNDHCQVCEFRRRCHQQAVQEDNLSLLRGMGERELKAYSRKGLLTLTQLAHTFRPRRKGKRQAKNTHKRYHALQALAVRDKRIYVFGTPELRECVTRVYLDMEGDPEEGYVYLIGVLVVRDGEEQSYPFWAGSRCPSCGSSEVVSGSKKGEPGCPGPRKKIAFDLVLAPGGIKRRVIECRSSVHKCMKCKHAFVPEEHQRLARHFHGLRSWAMYQHVAHRLSLHSVQVMLEEFFGLRLVSSEVYQIKSLMAQYYQATYLGLLNKILAGNLLHIDETEMTLQTGKCYVWVLSNLEEVVLLYKPTREGDFLKELLKDFKGVLVSDFYAAYDSLDCPQQKCLIHLMRDMNQELLNNPFDEELKSVTRPFGALLRVVVRTIDEHGLKRRHLQRHKPDVDGFFNALAEQAFRSDAAEALRKRLLKSRDKLFTFIEQDGVPWNNNNAENAIKQFAYYREDAKGIVTELGLCNHLVLLSIYQTCRYKRVSFLKFLASGLQDVDAFREMKRASPGKPALETYPAGFVRWQSPGQTITTSEMGG